MTPAEKEKQDKLYEQLRLRAKEHVKLIAGYLDEKVDVIEVERAEELLATLRVMRELGRETRRFV